MKHTETAWSINRKKRIELQLLEKFKNFEVEWRNKRDDSMNEFNIIENTSLRKKQISKEMRTGIFENEATLLPYWSAWARTKKRRKKIDD